MPIAKEILDMLDLGRKAISSNFSSFFYIENTKKSQRRRLVFPLCDGFRLFLPMAMDGPIAKNHCSVGTLL